MDEQELPVPVAHVLAEPPVSRARTLWERIERERGKKRRARRRVRRALVFAAAAAAALLLFVLYERPPAPETLALRDRATLPAVLAADHAASRAVDLSDGSRITIARGARVDVLVASPKRVELVLREGRARFDVRPRGPRSWRIESSGVSVEVVGTSFVVERTQRAVTVDVLHGIVLVRGPGLPDGVRRLTDGEHVRVALDPPLSSHDAPTREAAPHVQPEASSPLELTPQAPLRSAKKPAPAATPDPSGMGALWEAVDTARLRRAPGEAIAILDVLASRETRASQRALAAFTAGKIALDELDQPTRAARDLASAIALGLPSALDIDARTRLVEAHARAGNRNDACTAARALDARVAGRGALLARHCDTP